MNHIQYLKLFTLQLSLIEPADWWYAALPGWLARLARVGRLFNIKYLYQGDKYYFFVNFKIGFTFFQHFFYIKPIFWPHSMRIRQKGFLYRFLRSTTQGSIHRDLSKKFNYNYITRFKFWLSLFPIPYTPCWISPSLSLNGVNLMEINRLLKL